MAAACVMQILLRQSSARTTNRAGMVGDQQPDKPVPAYPATNDQIDIGTEVCSGGDAAQPRPRLRVSSAANARLTNSLKDKPASWARVRTCLTNWRESFTVKATLVSLTGSGCFRCRACCR